MNSLPKFLETLEANDLLKRIPAEVDPELEITEIVQRLYVQKPLQTPALLFEKVKGFKFPLAINTLGSEKSIELLLGDKPENISGNLAEAAKSLQHLAPQGKLLSWAWRQRDLLLKVRAARATRVSDAPFKEVKKFKDAVDLSEFPIMKSWPLDGGKFITAGLVLTKSPKTGARNLGIYRLQVFGRNELGLHWQIQKGGGFHYAEAQELNQPLEVAVILGDPLLWFAGILPLPEGMDEISFSALLTGRPVPMVRCETLDLEVPANAEIVIEGFARPGRRKPEGPFGDHFGHYSHQAPFPVMEIQCVTHKKNAVYHSAVVGKPPQEDRAMGEAVTKIFLPILQMMKPELVDLWAYYEAGFHNLLVASARQRYEKEAVKTALSLLGEGQLSLSKCIILVDPEVNVRSFAEVLGAVRDHFDPGRDFILLPGTSQDTLDFTGPRINRGSKMILDATAKGKRPKAEKKSPPAFSDPDALGWRALEDTLFVVKTQGEGRPLLRKLLGMPALKDFKMIAVVSEDVPLEDDVLLSWGIFTRFDCERDVLFGGSKLEGVRPIYSGPLGIDATWKPEYPKPLQMEREVSERVTRRWKEYGF